MNRIRFIVLSLVAVTLLSHRPTLAQEPEVPELPKPLAMRGSIEVKVDDKGNLVVTPKIFVPEERMGTRTVCKTVMDTVEQTYQVAVDGKTETRTRVASVPRQISEQVPYTYNVIAESPELREPLINSRVLYPYARYSSILEASQVQNSDAVLFVNTSADGFRVAQLLEETNRRLFELTTLDNDEQKIDYIVVQNETYDYANSSEETAVAEETARALETATQTAPFARRGSISDNVDKRGNLQITPTMMVPAHEQREGTRTVCKTVVDSREESYEVDVNGKKETRTRTVEVPRQVSEQVPYTYTVTICKPEVGESLNNPRVVRCGQDLAAINTASEVLFASKNAPNSEYQWIFVKTTKEADSLNRMITEANRLTAESLGARTVQLQYIVITDEKFDYPASFDDHQKAAIATFNNRTLSNSPASPAAPAPAPAAETAPPAWPLPAEKSAWINSLPFTQKNLNGKATVLWFFEEGCPKCRAHWKELNSLPLDYRGKPVVFVAVNSGNNPDAVAEYAKKNKVNLAVIADTDRQLEKFAGVGEISLENIWQAVIMTPDGKLHRANANDLEATAKEAMKLVR